MMAFICWWHRWQDYHPQDQGLSARKFVIDLFIVTPLQQPGQDPAFVAIDWVVVWVGVMGLTNDEKLGRFFLLEVCVHTSLPQSLTNVRRFATALSQYGVHATDLYPYKWDLSWIHTLMHKWVQYCEQFFYQDILGGWSMFFSQQSVSYFSTFIPPTLPRTLSFRESANLVHNNPGFEERIFPWLPMLLLYLTPFLNFSPFAEWLLDGTNYLHWEL